MARMPRLPFAKPVARPAQAPVATAVKPPAPQVPNEPARAFADAGRGLVPVRSDDGERRRAATSFISWDVQEGVEALVSQGKVLTDPALPAPPYPVEQPSKEIADGVVLFESGLLLVSEGMASSPLVRDFEVRNTRSAAASGVDLRVRRVVVPQQMITEVRRRLTETDGASQSYEAGQRQFVAMLTDAVKVGATDLHFEVLPEHNTTIIERRVMGDMQRVGREDAALNAEDGAKLQMAVYYMTDTAKEERRIEYFQQGRVLANRIPEVAAQVTALRLNYNPLASGGAWLAVRILPRHLRWNSLADLGYWEPHIQELEEIIRLPNGVFIIGGVMGSGKTTSNMLLLRLIREMTKGNRKFAALEDPPEYELQGISQVQLAKARTQQEQAEAYEAGLRNMVRSDVNYFMFGEVRDAMSALYLFQAAEVGMWVTTTLHVRHAMAVPQRLDNFGLPLWQLTESGAVNGFACQNLVKKVCPVCSFSLEEALSREIVDDALVRRLQNAGLDDMYLGNVRIANEAGCASQADAAARNPECRDGHIGMGVVAEIVRPSSAVMALVGERRHEAARDKALEEGFKPLLAHGLWNVRRGLMSPLDVERRLGSFTRLTRDLEIGGVGIISPTRDMSRRGGGVG